MKVKNSLGIFWSSPSGDEEAAGLYFYNISLSVFSNEDISFIENIWKNESIEMKFDHYQLDESQICVNTIVLRIIRWPDNSDWKQLICDTLRNMAQLEGTLAWCGDESSSTHPDALMPGGGVYATYARETGCLYNCGLSEEMTYLSAEQQLSLKPMLDRFKKIYKWG